jgi:hypothetical protein
MTHRLWCDTCRLNTDLHCPLQGGTSAKLIALVRISCSVFHANSWLCVRMPLCRCHCFTTATTSCFTTAIASRALCHSLYIEYCLVQRTPCMCHDGNACLYKHCRTIASSRHAGFTIAAKACYNPSKCSCFFDRMLEFENSEYSGGKTPEWQSDHPATEERARAAHQSETAAMAYYNSAPCAHIKRQARTAGSWF